MRATILSVVGILVWALTVKVFTASLLNDNFKGDSLDPTKWRFPTWSSPTDGTLVGRTQFRVTQNSPLPETRSGAAIIALDLYNPTGLPFYGTDLISEIQFQRNTGIHIIVRAKMATPRNGIVGSIFIYALKPGSDDLHDEIDFELVTNLPDGVLTNVYDNEPLSAGRPQFVPYVNGAIYDYHTYEIKWLADEVSWYADGSRMRNETHYIPRGPMYFHLDIWAPGREWSDAHDHNLQPVRSPTDNKSFTMNVDSVNIQSIVQASNSETTELAPSLVPLLQLLLGR